MLHEIGIPICLATQISSIIPDLLNIIRNLLHRLGAFAFSVVWYLYVPQASHSKILPSDDKVNLWVLYGSQDKQRLRPYT
jgi:hypothetical protein